MQHRYQKELYEINGLMPALYGAIARLQNLGKDDTNFLKTANQLYQAFEQTIDLLDKADFKVKKPQVLTEALTTKNKEFKEATSELFVEMKKNHPTGCLQSPVSVTALEESPLINDIGRADTVCLTGDVYLYSPEFRENDIGAREVFIAKRLPSAYLAKEQTQGQPNLLHKSFSQSLYYLSKKAIGDYGIDGSYALKAKGILTTDLMLFTSANTTANLTTDISGTTYLTVVASNFTINKVGSIEKSLPFYLPGVFISHFKLTQSGFVLDWFKASNPTILKLVTTAYSDKMLPLYVEAIGLRDRSTISAPEKFEKQNFLKLLSSADLSVQSAWTRLNGTINDKVPDILQKSIQEVTLQIIQDPFNQCLIMNYLGLATQAEESYQLTLKNALQQFVEACQLEYAPGLIMKQLPQILMMTTDLLKGKALLPQLIAYQTAANILSQLPGEWGNLGKSMLAILHTPTFELTLLQFRLQQYPTTSPLITFLLKDTVYPKLVNGLENAQKTQTAEHLFSDINTSYYSLATKLLSKREMSEASEKDVHLIDAVIQAAMQELFNQEGKLHVDLEEILNTHNNFFYASVDKDLQYKKLVYAYINNLILPNVTHKTPALSKLINNRLDQLFAEHKDFLKDYQEIFQASVSEDVSKKKSKDKDYMKMFKHHDEATSPSLPKDKPEKKPR